ncbi:DUF4136 domain-containing protein [candidate division KSB1 bacterium]|nr:DUF4136 domain-containing protein [candidate division KSB1 bacterium]
MKAISVLTVSVLLLVGVGCSPISVSHDYDPQANFSNLKTFAWVAFPQNVEINQLTVRRIKNAVTNELLAKGLQESSSNADILIAMHGTTKEKLDITDWGYSTGSYYGGGYWGGRNIDVNQYTEGTLILDFIDSKSKRLVWRGVAKGAVDPSLTPEQRTKRINEGAAKLMAQFPPAGMATK